MKDEESACAFDATEGSMNRPAAVLPATEVRVIQSAIADSDYQISVALPYHYDDEADKVWPVIYVLDSNLYFGLVVDMVRTMNIRVEDCNELPDAFIVGVGYPVEGSLSTILHEVMHRRMRDFLRTAIGTPRTSSSSTSPSRSPASAGKAAAFWRFLHQELTPLIESEYRADPGDRTLLGHSWGATFALYTALQGSARLPSLRHREFRPQTSTTRRTMPVSMTACPFASTSCMEESESRRRHSGAFPRHPHQAGGTPASRCRTK